MFIKGGGGGESSTLVYVLYKLWSSGVVISRLMYQEVYDAHNECLFCFFKNLWLF